MKMMLRYLTLMGLFNPVHYFAEEGGGGDGGSDGGADAGGDAGGEGGDAAGSDAGDAGADAPAAAPDGRKSTLSGGDDQAADDGDGGQAAEAVDYSAVELPEGITLDEAALEQFSPILNEANLTAEAAAPLFAKFAEYQAAEQTRATKEFNDGWDADAAIVAKMPKEDLAAAKTILDTYGDDEAKELMSGRIGEIPAVIRMLTNIGKAAAEGKWIEGGSGNPSTEKPDTKDVLFPTMKGGE